ncbi:hypothetical protein CAPTEDRAFT_208721 [Capitella teleta]|uniref:Uncharacterized protein n=1 Tax=Capitella teleta TaxID=283909 RepID=R7TWU1_CAPTE|nr:hypothetical protein CAPTEDRAFT_208721 [Capitella teleta]|eukprot:ELT95440.1 hypothetical protein CAPTEDRAFT_208721 [Capitella teleta]
MDRGKEQHKFLNQNQFVGQYQCFTYSQLHEGILCKVCVLFAPNGVHGQELGKLVKQPLKKDAHLTGKTGRLHLHIKTRFLESCLTASILFKKTVDSGNDVVAQVNRPEAEEGLRNRKALRIIIKAIEFHGRLGHSLCGPRVSSRLGQVSDLERYLRVQSPQKTEEARAELFADSLCSPKWNALQ